MTTWIPERRSVWTAIRRGLGRRCPSCGEGRSFSGYLKTQDCQRCSAALERIRADDLPPYVTIFIVGHIVIPLLLITERLWAPEAWVHLVLWLPLTVALTLALLPMIKGGAVGLMWALGLNGREH